LKTKNGEIVMNAFIDWLKACEYQLKSVSTKCPNSKAAKIELERINAALELYEEWKKFKADLWH
jgi:hypothetical protein